MSEDKLVPPPETPRKPAARKDRLQPVLGEVSKIIGSGENAQHSIVYKTIGWSFAAGVFFSLLGFAYSAYCGSTDPIDSLKGVWSIFIPVITLSLGYLFGRSGR